MKLDVAQTWPGRCSRCQLAGEMEPRVGQHSSLFCLAIVFIPCAAGSRGNDQMGKITLQLLINLSESRQLIMARKVHMNVVYVTGSGNVLRHTLEHIKAHWRPRWSHKERLETTNTSGDHALNEEDALELQPNPKYLEGVRRSLGLERCNTVMSPSQSGQKEDLDEREVLADHENQQSDR